MIIRIPRTAKRNTISVQTERDEARINERVRRNAAPLRVIEPLLARICGKPTIAGLIGIADHCLRETGLPIRLDRLARRSRIALLCWFCENWGQISEPLMKQFSINLPRTGDPPDPPAHPASEASPLSITSLLNH